MQTPEPFVLLFFSIIDFVRVIRLQPKYQDLRYSRSGLKQELGSKRRKKVYDYNGLLSTAADSHGIM